jgi:hypothetical protein
MADPLIQASLHPRRYRLLARAQLDGAVREPGYVFRLAEGENGPHKTVVASNVGGMAWRQSKELTPDDAAWPAGWIMPEEHTPMMRDEPLFEEIYED